MELSHLSKSQLNELLRRITGRGRDLARHSKPELAEALSKLPAAAVEQAIGSMGLIAGAMPSLAAGNGSPVPAQQPVEQPVVEIVAKRTLGEIFGIGGKHSGIVVDVWGDPEAPKLDPLYGFDPEQLFSAVQALKRGRNCWLAGPAGTGKTEFVKNLCAGLGRAFVRVQFDSGAERYEFIGGERVRNGSTVYQRGIVLLGMTRPGAVILLDEVSMARPEYLAALHSVLEPEGTVTIPETGEIVRKAQGVVFFAADNSNGRGDYTGLYAGVREQNVAFVNRFAKTLVFSYMTPGVEAKVIAGRTGCQLELSRLIVNFLTVCRSASEKAELDHVPTLREAFYLAEALSDGQVAQRAFEECVVNRASNEAQEVLQQIWKANVAETDIALAIEGQLGRSIDDSEGS
jgi:MoxR-like ATPase